MNRLSSATLHESAVPVPGYDRSDLTVGIAHFGVGGFHRAHQALVIDELLRQGEASDWAIMGLGVRPQDSAMRAALTAQDGLYTLVEKHADGTRDARVIGSVLGMLTVPEDGAEAVLAVLTAPTTRIVSLTVTEGGYNINQSTGDFLLDTPEVAADLVADAVPATVFGLVVEALQRRRAAGTAPFTVMSCDNLQDNGRIARRAMLSFAEAKDAELAAWIAEHVYFPNSMVDRITPVTTDGDRAETATLTGLEDAWPVVCEPFFQWVLEDSFVNGRPPYEKARVHVVDDVEPYELMKLRLLNASHQAVAHLGCLRGYVLVDDAMRDPHLEDLLRRYMSEEARPTLHPVPGIDLDEYCDELISRFSNPEVRDTIARLCAEASDRIPKWLVPVIIERLDAGGDVTRAAAVVAGWARCATGVGEQGETIEIVDGRREQIMAAAAPSDDPLAFVRDRALFGDLAEREGFTVPYLHALSVLNSDGSEALLAELSGTA